MTGFLTDPKSQFEVDMDLRQTGQRATIAYIVSVVLFFVVLAVAMKFMANARTSIGLAYAVSWLGFFTVFGIFFQLDKNQTAK